jgi:hypothetical protein
MTAQDRGGRRALRERNLKRWQRIVKSWHMRSSDEAWFSMMVRKLAGHGKLCSCYMCGNRRASEGPTIQERRAAIAREQGEKP